jgi:Predicted permeases
MESICGSLTYAPLIVLAGVPISNAFSVIILSLEAGGDRPDRVALRRALAGVIKNPLIIGILLGLPFAFFRIPIPAAADKGLALLANMASPLALLVIGAEFRADAAVKKLRSTVCAGLIKLLLLPALTIFAAAALGFRGEAMVAVLVFSGTPTAVASYIMAENMHNDGVLANGIVAFTTLLSAVTVTGWIFLLRVTGLI